MANDRVAQLPVEVIVAPTAARARLAQYPVEAAVSPTSSKAKVASVVVQVLILNSSPARARVIGVIG